jgi:general secretion pathway protein D
MPLFRYLVLLVLSVSSAVAQAPSPPITPPSPPTADVAGPKIVPPGPPKALPGGGAGLAAPVRKPVREPVRDPNVPLGDTRIEEPIEKPTLNGAELAALYRKYTGRRVIVAAIAATTEFSFVQDASPDDPLTYAQAAELLKKAAAIENFVFIPDEKSPNLDILTVSSRPPGVGYDVFNENDELPEGDAVVSYVMTFKHIKPEIAAQAFTQIIGQFGTYGSIAPLNGSVVITENTSLIRRLIKLKQEIDKPSDVTATRFISVKYSDVTELAATLNDLLNAQQQAQKSAAVQRSGVPAAPVVPGAPAVPPQNAAVVGGGAATSTDTPVQIIPEPRTNRVFAMGRPVDLLFVEGLIREFDIETSEKTFLRRKLRFLTVSDFLPIAENALNRAFTSTGDSAGGAAGGAAGAAGGAARTNSRSNSGTRSNSANRNSATAGNNSFGSGNSSFGSGGATGSGGGSSGSGGGSALGSPQTSTAPESRLVGRTLLVADNITNSIVVQGPPSGLEIVERLLDQVDVKADQVMISTVIGQLTLGDDKDFGVGYLFNNNDNTLRGGGGGGLPALKPVAGSNNLPELDLSQIAASGLRLYGRTGDLSIFLKALQSKSDFTVLARPSIFTANNQKGVISSGERVAIPTGTNAYGGGVNGNVSTQIQYQDVVLKLEVIPLINSENEITLQISLLNDEVTGTQTIAGGAGANDLVVPKITTREILTTVTIPNNETIVLGGLITARKGDSVSGIPLLSSIPYLGKLFSTTSKKDERQELLVFLQPSIIRNRNSLDTAQIDMDRRYRVSGDLRNFADGPGVLPPVDAIPPVADKGHAPKARPVVLPPPAPTKIKKSIRPEYRQ